MSSFLIDLETWLQLQTPPLADVLRRLAGACAQVARASRRGALARLHQSAGIGAPARYAASGSGAQPTALDCLSDGRIASALAGCPHVAAWASEERSTCTVSTDHASTGAYLVAYDPLDGATNIEPNASVGTIFSVMPHLFRGTPASDAAFMQPGRRQVAAGFVLYGPSTVLVLSAGHGVHMFTLDPEDAREGGHWLMTREGVSVPHASNEFAINAANQRHWEKPVQRYVAECLAGAGGPRGRDFAMRWTATLACDAQRILTRGGVFLYPRDNRQPYRPGRMRLLFEAAPIAYLMEHAGGRATNGSSAILDLVPDALQQQVPLIFGSRKEVDRVTAYHSDASENVSWQLFKTRSLFIQPNG